MSNVNTLLVNRLKKPKKNEDDTSKMAAMAQRSAQGNLSGFSGVFSVGDLNSHEKELLKEILTEYAVSETSISEDLDSLISITSEVKAINNQAAILHGERIKKAQTILKRYRDGAFSSWLINAYGNRQTPYNFLQYYEFCEAIPSSLRSQIEAMPRQAIYTLASRDGPLQKKQKIIEAYKGQTKAEILQIIRDEFPLDEEDNRKSNPGENAIQHMERALRSLSGKHVRLRKGQMRTLNELLVQLDELINP